MVRDAGYEKLRLVGIVRKIAVLTAVGKHQKGNRRILVVSIKLNVAELRWREIFGGLVHQGLSGAEYIATDDHPRLKASRRAVFTGSLLQRYLETLYVEYGRLFASTIGSRT